MVNLVKFNLGHLYNTLVALFIKGNIKAKVRSTPQVLSYKINVLVNKTFKWVLRRVNLKKNSNI